LFTFLKFPQSQWKGLRTTNALERINEEFRRRTKTQSSLPNGDAVLLRLFGLLRSGQISLRKMDGAQVMAKVSVPLREKKLLLKREVLEMTKNIFPPHRPDPNLFVAASFTKPYNNSLKESSSLDQHFAATGAFHGAHTLGLK